MAKKRVRVLVANAAGARMLRADAETRKLELLRSYPHLAGRAKAGDLVTDRPGRSFDSSHAGGRHAMEPDTALKRAELRRFVHELAGELEASAGTFDDLIIVAGPRMLGEIRQALTDRVGATVRKEIGKDLAGLDVPTLTVELAPDLWK